MKGKQHPTNDVTLNPSCNESIHDVIGRTSLSRRTFIKSAVSGSVLAALGGVTMSGFMRAVHAAPVPAGNGFAGIGFESIPPALAPVADAVAVPPGYKVEVLAAWGDPIMPGAPAWREDASQDAAAQAKQFGEHNDGMHRCSLRCGRALCSAGDRSSANCGQRPSGGPRIGTAQSAARGRGGPLDRHDQVARLAGAGDGNRTHV